MVNSLGMETGEIALGTEVTETRCQKVGLLKDGTIDPIIGEIGSPSQKTEIFSSTKN